MVQWSYSVVLLLGCCIASTSYGLDMVYRQVEPDGHVTLSDRPLTNTTAAVEQIEIPASTNTGTSAPTTTSPVLSPAPATAAQKAVLYSIAIQSPRPQETLAWTAQDVTIVVNVAPKLGQGIKLQLYHNGVPEGIAQTQTKFKLPALPRGAHTFSAAIMNAEETEVLALSAPVTVFQHRTSTITSPLHQGKDSAE